MGVNTKIYLPGNVRADDVALVIGVLAGLPLKRQRLRDDKGDGDDNWEDIPEAPEPSQGESDAD